jgi:RHS repeat-associated protein
VIRATDPLGRETVFVYGTGSTPDPDPATGTGIDFLQLKQKNALNYDLLWNATYNAQHLPLSVTDAAGKTTTFTFNSAGQILTMITPQRAGISENRTTTWTYDANGYLQSVTGPAAGATTSFTYDGYGRARTATDSDSYTLTYDYDALDRQTRVSYPDGTYEEAVYNRLDAEKQRDRLGHWTHTTYDTLRRVVSIRDSLGGVVTQQWCSCGSLDKVIDANGNWTSWERDAQGRVSKEIRANGSETLYVYENTASRLKRVTDAKGQHKDYQYFRDNNLQSVTYPNPQYPTPNVSFTYDPSYNRFSTMVDGTGTTTYAYHPIGATPPLGAGRLASVDGPLPNDTVSYTYDELGRVASQSTNGLATSWSYDVLGRVTGESNALGSFSYVYDATTARILTVTYPNGQTNNLAYYPNSGDHRLQELHHRLSGGATLSKFNYTYDAGGNIKVWTQQTDGNPAKAFDLAYDAADQVTAATWRTTDPTPVTLKRHVYSYDAAGNRTTEQIDDSPMAASYDNMNRLVSQQAGGALRFKGTLNEAATATIQGKPAQVSADNKFEGPAQVTSGTNSVEVKAKDYSGNERTNTYQVTVSGSSKTLSYDANGNLIGDGSRTFEWDAENRVIAVNQGALRSEFSYDGSARRVRVIEKDGGVVTSDRRFLWCDAEICEERDAGGSTSVRRFFSLGMQEGASSFFYARDHLGSIREMTDSSGAIAARYDYDPYGRVTKISGNKDSVFNFTGEFFHGASGLSLTLFRAYDPNLGRWLSEDPIGFGGGTNTCAYVSSNPLNFLDPLGLLQQPAVPGETVPLKKLPGKLLPFPGGGAASAAAGGAASAAAAAAGAAAAAILIVVTTPSEAGETPDDIERTRRGVPEIIGPNKDCLRRERRKCACWVRCTLIQFGDNPSPAYLYPRQVTGIGVASNCTDALRAAEQNARENWAQWMKANGIQGVRVKHCVKIRSNCIEG